MQTIRTFIAIPIMVEPLLAAVWIKLRQRYSSQEVNWAAFDTLHLTLFFLGETPLEAMHKIQHELTGALLGLGPFSLTLHGLGCFEKKGNPKVIWVGAEKNAELTQLHSITSTTVSRLGFKPDERGFNPHITLGRPRQLKNTSNLYFDIRKNVNTVFQVSIATEIIHYRSELRPTGPLYSKLYGISLVKPTLELIGKAPAQ